MPIQLRLAAILAIAVMTAVVHHRYLVSKTATRYFVATATELKVGQRPAINDIRPAALGGDLPMLGQLLVPWDERLMFVETPVLREYQPGELLVRRDVEQRVIGPYSPGENEYVVIVELSNLDGLKNAFQIGSEIGFLISSKSGDASDKVVAHCGPFVLRQIGSLSRQLDHGVMQKIPTRSVALSLAKSTSARIPAQAQTLLNAVSGNNGARIVGFYHP